MGLFYTKESYQDGYGRSRDKIKIHKVRIAAAAVLALVVLVVALRCFTIITAGHTGVVSTFGKVSEEVMQEGFHFKAPWQKVTKMDNRIVKLEVETEAFSSDLQTVSVNLAVNYRVDTNMSYFIVKNIGTKYEDVLITPAVNEVMKSIMAQYTAEQSITNRNAVSKALMDGLNEKLTASGVYISDINIIDFDFSDVYIAAIEAKQVAEQEKLKAQIEQEQLTMEKQAAAERQLIEAQTEAEAAKIEADAAAYSGQKQAEANEKIAASLTDMLVDYYKVQQWNGQLPTVAGSDTLIGFGQIAD
ncbi:prohibitin family protein [uncultured Mailhella sp.]|uniref:prohibitin family protein n=1 Tax=uncultured Mailhella sp. TaxID=1981031 RepID=UPI00260B5E1F|nr:prohibitin family protein [uncultured Mailhella sp.]